MSKLKYILLSANLAVLVILFLFSVSKSEHVINEGESVYLKLRPVDPRSMMQGDYMTLNLDINNMLSSDYYGQQNSDSLNYAIVSKDEGELLRVQYDIYTKNSNEIALKISKNIYARPEIAIKNLFFQEGEGDKYADAKFAHVKVDECGICILVGLGDENKTDIE